MRRITTHRPPVAALSALLLLVAPALACAPEPTPRPRGEGPSLILLVVIDQGRADYVERYRPLLDGGLGRLLDAGVRFTEARHGHAETTTAPGHASIASGRHPSRSGVVGNYWFDREHGERVYSASPPLGDGTGGPASPGHLEVDTLGDWIRASDPASKVFAASGKDRAAVMLGGKEPSGAFWYDRATGEWTTSDHYAEELPGWLRSLNERDLLERHFGTLWEPLPLEPSVAEGLGIRPFHRDPSSAGFPHPVGRFSLEPDPGFYAAIYDTPFLDRYLVDLALELLEAEELGRDGSVDLLALSFSAVDTVGHDHGPGSPEVLDTVRRLDRGLGRLLDRVDELVGAEHVVVALSADHGVAPVPEVRRELGMEATRLGPAPVRCFQQVGRSFEERRGEDDWFLWPGYLNEATLERRGLSVEQVVAELAAGLETCPGVERVWTAADLAGEGPDDDPVRRAFRNSWHPQRSPDLMVQFDEYAVSIFSAATTHGSVYDYDARVPLVVAGPGVQPGRVDDVVYTVDIAPTLAALAGVPVPEGLDGVDRSGLLPAGR